jgi:hypothetical protein
VSAQFRVPPAPNVLSISLPLMRIDQARLQREAARWRDDFVNRKRPLVAVLVGGATQPFVFDAASAIDLIRIARDYCSPNGSLYVTTSRRTPIAAIAALRAALGPHDALFEWTANAEDNPYFGLLAHADGFVVTGDSMSMITEVARLGRPLAIFPLRRSSAAMTLRRLLPKALAELPNTLKYRVLPRIGVTAFPRDLTQIHRDLICSGIAVAAGDPFPQVTRDGRDEVASGRDEVASVRDEVASVRDEVDRVVAAIVRIAAAP